MASHGLSWPLMASQGISWPLNGSQGISRALKGNLNSLKRLKEPSRAIIYPILVPIISILCIFLGYSWPNGEEAKFDFVGLEQDFKLYASKRKFINVTQSCSKYLQDDCETDILANFNYSNCENPCIAVNLPKSATKSLDFKDVECKTVSDQTCMTWNFNTALNEIIDKCPRNCENVQYSGKSTFLLPTTGNDTYYRKYALIFANKKIAVEEEYLIMDFTGLIGAVGGTLGLFIGFSFKEITSLLIDGLKWILKKTRVSSATSDTRVLMIKE